MYELKSVNVQLTKDKIFTYLTQNSGVLSGGYVATRATGPPIHTNRAIESLMFETSSVLGLHCHYELLWKSNWET